MSAAVSAHCLSVCRLQWLLLYEIAVASGFAYAGLIHGFTITQAMTTATFHSYYDHRKGLADLDWNLCQFEQ